MSKFCKTLFHFVCIFILLSSVALGLFFCRNSYSRLVETVRDLGTSTGIYFCNMFGIDNDILPTVTFGSSVPWNVLLPFDFGQMAIFFKSFVLNFADKTVFISYLEFLLTYIPVILQVLIIFALFGGVLIVPILISLRSRNNDFNRDTIPLRIFKKAMGIIYVPAKKNIIAFKSFVKEHKAYLYLLGLIWFINANGASILFAFVAYVFYFGGTSNIVSIPFQIYKLLIDVAITASSLPVIVWLILLGIFFVYRCRERGFKRLQHREAHNRKFISSLSLFVILIGEMGKGKTTLLSDIALSKTVMFRERAFEIIKKVDMHFPYFPWILYEKTLQKLMKLGKVYNLATLSIWIGKQRKLFENNSCRENIFTYDYARYGLTFDNGLAVLNIWDELETYGKAYLIYITQSSLLISNFAMREDYLFHDEGNFPVWEDDFFRRPSVNTDTQSMYAHNLDQDVIRLGVRINKKNAMANFYEFGVICITEIGKERGNKFDASGEDKKSDEANRKNDNVDKFVKMIRHSSTVDFSPFAFMIGDEQRAMNIGADLREVCDLLYIEDKDEMEVLLPFYEYFEFVYKILSNCFNYVYDKLRVRRGDNTLFVHIFKTLTAKLGALNERIINIYGSTSVTLLKEKGMENSKERIRFKYYVSTKKDYSDRFATDCFNAFFKKKALLSPVGLDGIPCYKNTVASMSELEWQNSYFVKGVSSCFNAFEKQLTGEAVTPKKKICKKKTGVDSAKDASPQSPK